MLRQGGFLETQEFEFTFYNMDDQVGSDSWAWLRRVRTAATQKWTDFTAAPKIASFMNAAGLVDIEVHESKLLFGYWPKYPESGLSDI